MKEIKLALVYRDMWQAAGKYVPRVDQLVRVADPIIEMGCFSRVETNGGGFEQVNLLYGEDPNKSVRDWTTPFNKEGIQTQMLERGLNALRMSPVPADVRKLMFAVKKKQGTDISRSFDGLNNPQNLALSFQYAKEGGMIAQGALSLTFSPIHTVEYYINLANKFVELGAQEICLKDMAGIGRPVSIGKICAGIRKNHPDILIQYHGHSTTGFSIASSLEAARNGADIIDVGMEPLSYGTGHADLLTIHAILKDAGFKLPDVNMEAYMAVRSLTQEFIDDFLGYFINPTNRQMLPLVIGPGLPGGMMGSLMSDLENNLFSLNKWLNKKGKASLTQDELLIKLFNEVEYIWPLLGYPPLVTPFSQYVKNVALMNVIQMQKGKSRWSMIDENTWSMILGKSGKLPGPIAAEIKALAIAQNREFFSGNPQELYPDELELYRNKMSEKNWDSGKDEEDLLEYAMHPLQFERYKSGEAKADFLKVLNEKRPANKNSSIPANETITPTLLQMQPKELIIEVNGEKYQVTVDYPDSLTSNGQASSESNHFLANPKSDNTNFHYVTAPLEGKVYLTNDPQEKAVKIGDSINEGDTVAYIESMKVINAIKAEKDGIVEEILISHGNEIEEDDKIIKLK